MKKILIVIGHYLPGYRSGGPQRTVENLCAAFEKRAEIYILTLNRDFGIQEQYDVPTNIWLKRYGVNVMYVNEKDFGYRLFSAMFAQFENIYTCSLFARSTYLNMIVNRSNNKGTHNFYVAPMGVFSKGAIEVKFIKKMSFLRLCSTFGLFDNVIWSFSSIDEFNDAKNVIGEKCIKKYVIAEDLPTKIDFENSRRSLHTKEPGILKIVFMSRIVPKKNLQFAVDCLNFAIEGSVIFDIYGTLEDEEYWHQVQTKASALPANVSVRYCGELAPEKVVGKLSNYDLFLFPTKGENFGHVIYESLSAGCIPIISDQTPWNDLSEKECGRVVPLSDIKKYRTTITEMMSMNGSDFRKMQLNAIDYAEHKYIQSIKSSGYEKILL